MDPLGKISSHSRNGWLEVTSRDALWTNRERLDLARVLQKLGRTAKAGSLLDQLLMSMKDIIEPDNSDTSLMEEAEGLKKDLGTSMG